MNSTTWTTTHGDTVEVYDLAVRCLRADCAVHHHEYRWRVRAANGEIVGSGEAYTRKAAAIKAAERHHPRVEPAPAVDPIPGQLAVDEGGAA